MCAINPSDGDGNWTLKDYLNAPETCEVPDCDGNPCKEANLSVVVDSGADVSVPLLRFHRLGSAAERSDAAFPQLLRLTKKGRLDDRGWVAVFVREDSSTRLLQPGDVWIQALPLKTADFEDAPKKLEDINAERKGPHDVAVLFQVEEIPKTS